MRPLYRGELELPPWVQWLPVIHPKYLPWMDNRRYEALAQNAWVPLHTKSSFWCCGNVYLHTTVVNGARQTWYRHSVPGLIDSAENRYFMIPSAATGKTFPAISRDRSAEIRETLQVAHHLYRHWAVIYGDTEKETLVPVESLPEAPVRRILIRER